MGLFNDKSAGSGFGPRKRPRRGEIQDVFHQHDREIWPIRLGRSRSVYFRTASSDPDSNKTRASWLFEGRSLGLKLSNTMSTH